PAVNANGPISSATSIRSFKPTSIKPDEGFACVPRLPAAPAPYSKPSGLPCRRRSNSPLSHLPIRRQATTGQQQIRSAKDFWACCKQLIMNNILNQGVKVGCDSEQIECKKGVADSNYSVRAPSKPAATAAASMSSAPPD